MDTFLNRNYQENINIYNTPVSPLEKGVLKNCRPKTSQEKSVVKTVYLEVCF